MNYQQSVHNGCPPVLQGSPESLLFQLGITEFLIIRKVTRRIQNETKHITAYLFILINLLKNRFRSSIILKRIFGKNHYTPNSSISISKFHQNKVAFFTTCTNISESKVMSFLLDNSYQWQEAKMPPPEKEMAAFLPATFLFKVVKFLLGRSIYQSFLLSSKNNIRYNYQ